jgi:hypothetical protein
MNIPPRNLPGGYMHLDFTPLHPWGDGTTVQWGKSGYGGYFIEALPAVLLAMSGDRGGER